MSIYPRNYQVILQGSIVGNIGQTRNEDNVFNYSATVSGSGYDNTAQFLALFLNNVQTPWLAAKDYSYVLQQAICIDLDNPLNAPSVLVINLHGTYNMTPGAPLPSDLCAFLFLKTNYRGKSSHGGVHLGGNPAAALPGGATSPNEWSGAYATLLGNVLSALLLTITDSNSSKWNICVLSRKNSSLVPPPPPVNVQSWVCPTANCFVDLTIGTQRRRKERTTR